MNHVVQFYEDDAFLCDTVARFIGAGLAAGESVVIIATDLHRHGFIQRLRSNDFDVDRVIASGRLQLLDAQETLSQLTVGDAPDWDRALDVIGAVLDRAARAGTGVRAYGEMVDSCGARAGPPPPSVSSRCGTTSVVTTTFRSCAPT